MELLNEIKFFNRTNKIPSQCLKNGMMNMRLKDGITINMEDLMSSYGGLKTSSHKKME